MDRGPSGFRDFRSFGFLFKTLILWRGIRNIRNKGIGRRRKKLSINLSVENETSDE